MKPGLYWARDKSKTKFRRPDYAWTGLVNLRGKAPFLRPSIMYNFVDNCHIKAEINLYELKEVKPSHMYTVNDLLPEEIEAGLYLDPNSLLLIKVEGVNPFLTFTDVAHFRAGLIVINIPSVTGSDILKNYHKLVIPIT